MNEKFFTLPIEKQRAIINAGYRVFSENSYKKSPMSEIADAAGISKPLLFHYFENKKGLYLFLWENCAKTTLQYLTEYKCYEQTDLFDMLYLGMKAKIRIMQQYPYMGQFAVKAFYETDPTVQPDIQKSYAGHLVSKADKALEKLDPAQFVEGIDLSMMYREMYLASEGYLWELMQNGPIDVEKMEQDFAQMIEFWKKIYLRKEG